MSEEPECSCEETKCPAGIPAWVMTFADLMTLLMCFFVLLLSFSEMDQNKYTDLISVGSGLPGENSLAIMLVPFGGSLVLISRKTAHHRYLASDPGIY